MVWVTRCRWPRSGPGGVSVRSSHSRCNCSRRAEAASSSAASACAARRSCCASLSARPTAARCSGGSDPKPCLICPSAALRPNSVDSTCVSSSLVAAAATAANPWPRAASMLASSASGDTSAGVLAGVSVAGPFTAGRVRRNRAEWSGITGRFSHPVHQHGSGHGNVERINRALHGNGDSHVGAPDWPQQTARVPRCPPRASCAQRSAAGPHRRRRWALLARARGRHRTTR